MDVKQVIVVRKDLNMRKGKIAAQVAHASMGVLFNYCERKDVPGLAVDRHIVSVVPQPLFYWLSGSFTKICVSCDSEQELLDLKKKSDEMNIENCLITDNGLTEFHGVPTKTCLAIGPDFSDKIDVIASHLKLL